MLNFQRNLFGFNQSSRFFQYLSLALSIQLLAFGIHAQDNSPYSRYGLGDLHPNSNIYNRGMAGISAAFSDPRIDGPADPRNGKYYSSINFTNPASYSRFYAIKEPNSNKLQFGRMLLDVGVNLSNRTLHEANNPESFSASNAYFSYMQVGIPIRKDLGLVFGLRPLSNISYKIFRNERLPVDSVQTQFIGDGGSYLFNTGAGFAIGNFSLGLNAGYLFGKKDYSTRRTFINDTVAYSASNHQTRTNFGGIFFNTGILYRIDLSKDKMKYLQLGAFGNMRHGLSTRSDIIRETYVIDQTDEAQLRLDSVTEQLEVKGKLTYPSTFGAGFIVEQLPSTDKQGWLFGVDYVTNNWDDYRLNGQADQVRSNWELKIGGQLRPKLPMQRSYRRLLAYRAGVFFGDDYVYLNNQKLSTWGISAGLSLPVANLRDPAAGYRPQSAVVNISAEYIKRGSSSNPINENQFRLSIGFTLMDRWFNKRKYD
jgi:hypothetical protein